MHSKVPGIALLILGLAAMAFAACTEGARTTVVNPSNEQTGITVAGLGEVFVTPDTASFDVGVQVIAATVKEASSSAAKAQAAVIDALKKNGVDSKDIRTAQLSIAPQYTYPRDGSPPKLTGYIATNAVAVKVHKFDTLPAVIDDATNAGGDSVTLSGIRFTLEDDTKALAQARDAALEDAQDRAKQLAAGAGVKLGDLLSLQETQVARPGPIYIAGKSTAESASPATPIEPGQSTISVTVSARWAVSN